MYRYNTEFKDEMFMLYLETGSGDEHPFLGFALNKKDTDSLELDIHEGIIPKRGTSYDVIKISWGNLLYIPDLPEEDDIYYVVNTFGEYGMEVEVKPKSNILTGERYLLNFQSTLDDKGVYKSIGHDEKIMELPSVAPISDYYIGKKLGRSEEFLVDIL